MPTNKDILLTAYGLLGDGNGDEWGDNPEYTRAICELVADTTGCSAEVDRGGDDFIPFTLDQIKGAWLDNVRGVAPDADDVD